MVKALYISYGQNPPWLTIPYDFKTIPFHGKKPHLFDHGTWLTHLAG